MLQVVEFTINKKKSVYSPTKSDLQDYRFFLQHNKARCHLTLTSNKHLLDTFANYACWIKNSPALWNQNVSTNQ